MMYASVRVVVFAALYVAAAALAWGPAAFFPLTLALGLTSFVEAPLFALACDGEHPDDAFMIESALALTLEVAMLAGISVAFAWVHGPLAAKLPPNAAELLAAGGA